MTSKARRRALGSSSGKSLHSPALLPHLLQELAAVLLAQGITPRAFGELSRVAYVHAAAERSKLRNGRINHSRVAAQTGLTRADVKRLLTKAHEKRSFGSGQTAIQKVIRGWCTDRKYMQKGRPRPLKVSGPGASFQSLARDYAGDVPYRAVLTELQQFGIVRAKQQSLILATSRYPYKNAISFNDALPALLDGVRIAGGPKGGDTSASIQRLVLPVDSDMDLRFVRDRCVMTVRAMLDGLSHSLNSTPNPSSFKKRTGRSFAITVLMVEAAKRHGRQKGTS